MEFLTAIVNWSFSWFLVVNSIYEANTNMRASERQRVENRQWINSLKLVCMYKWFWIFQIEINEPLFERYKMHIKFHTNRFGAKYRVYRVRTLTLAVCITHICIRSTHSFISKLGIPRGTRWLLAYDLSVINLQTKQAKSSKGNPKCHKFFWKFRKSPNQNQLICICRVNHHVVWLMQLVDNSIDFP